METKHFHISVQEAPDWDDIPPTAEPVTLSDAKKTAAFYGVKLWLQTESGEYLGSVHADGGVAWNPDARVSWRPLPAYWWAKPGDVYAHSMLK